MVGQCNGWCVRAPGVTLNVCQMVALERRPEQLALVRYLKAEVLRLWPDARVEIFGSLATVLTRVSAKCLAA